MIVLTRGQGAGAVRAVVSPRGASLRRLTVSGDELVHPTDTLGGSDEQPPGAAGLVLVPWPNRVGGARWTHDGVEQHLEVTEPALGHALHGLLASTVYEVVHRRPDAVTLAAPVRGRRGYPFELETAVRYRVDAGGLVVEHTISNVGPTSAPVAVGAHPYLRAGAAPVADLELRIRATTALELDARHLPLRTVDVAGTALDLRTGRLVRDAVRHAAYTALDVSDGVVSHVLRHRDGVATELWAEERFRWVQLWITPDLPGTAPGDLAVAVEPMTAPPDALRSGTDLHHLAPGATWELTWGVRAA